MFRSSRSFPVRHLLVMVAGVVLATSPACGGDAGTSPAPAGPPATARVLGPDCDAGRRAVAFRLGGGRVEPQPADAPVPCMTTAGPASEAALVAVTSRGDVVAAPLLAADHPPAPSILDGPALVAVSGDRAVTWTTGQAGEPAHGLHVPPSLVASATTPRIWFASVERDLCGTALSWSDDGGRTWEGNPSIGCPGMGSLRVLEGPAPAGAAAPAGYPNVVYVCANATDFAASLVHCYRSLDGGRTFTPIGTFPDPPVPPGCPTRHPARPGIVTPAGRLVFPVFVCDTVSVAVSDDEGATWQLHTVAAPESTRDLFNTTVASDEAGNLYLARIVGDSTGTAPDGQAPPRSPLADDAILGTGRPVISVSRDGGVTWSAPQHLTPPGVGTVERISVSARGRGQVTVSFFGSGTGADAQRYSGWIVTARDLLAREPLLWAAPVNDPAAPLANAPLTGTFGDRLFSLSNALGPDGTPWAAFHCVAMPTCTTPRSLVIGRLEL